MRWIFEKRDTLEGEYRRGIGNGYIIGVLTVILLIFLFIIMGKI